MIARLADHLAHFLTLASPVDRDARWDQARADVEAARAALAARQAEPSGAIVGDDEAAEIAARAAAATAGPWAVLDDTGGSGMSIALPGTASYDAHVVSGCDEYGCGVGDEADAAFIAHARADVPRLLADRAARIAERDALLADALRPAETDPEPLDPLRVESAVDAAIERAAGLDERIRYPDRDR